MTTHTRHTLSHLGMFLFLIAFSLADHPALLPAHAEAILHLVLISLFVLSYAVELLGTIRSTDVSPLVASYREPGSHLPIWADILGYSLLFAASYHFTWVNLLAVALMAAGDLGLRWRSTHMAKAPSALGANP